jgi:nicotinamide riboside kinase
MEFIKKIVILGPESTGKSTLCEQLANHYNTLWVPEFARTYLLEHGMNYSYQDLLTIAKGQIALEQKFIDELERQFRYTHSTISSNSRSGRISIDGDSSIIQSEFLPLFIDTNMHVMKVWCEFVFGKCHEWILQQITERNYDLYLLCNTDLPWISDALREYPDLESRQKLFHIYKDIMINQPVPWIEIEGKNEQRFEKALTAVDQLLAAL